MRVATASFYQQSIAAMQRQQSQLLGTQNQLATGQRAVTAAEDPLGVAHGLSLDQTLASAQRYSSNTQLASERLGLEENALASVNDTLNQVRERVLQAGNSTLSDADRKTIAAELRQSLAQLVSTANALDGEGRYLFAGAADAAAPFSLTQGGTVYNGDDVAHSLEISPDRLLATSDAGSEVFMRIASGNGRFSVSASAGNAGTAAIANAALADPAAYDGGSYRIDFAGGNFAVSDGSGNRIASGAYSAGQSIRFRGLDLRLEGSPVDGDSLGVAASRQQDVFETVRRMATLLETPLQGSASARAKAQTALYEGLSTLTTAQDHILDVRAQLGSRLQAAAVAHEQQGARAVSIETALSGLRDIDYAEATGRLSQQLLGLQAAQQSFLKIQGLSLFNYLR